MPTTAVMIEALIHMRHHEGRVNEEQFWVIVERFRADLVNQALAILGHQADAEDVAQESLARAYVDLHKLRDPRKLGAWIRSINRCNALDNLRRRRAQREERLNTGEQACLTKDQLPGRKVTPDQGEELTDDSEVVIQVVDRLPEKYREIVVLRYWEKMTLEQIAIQLGIPSGTVRSRIARADGMLVGKLRALHKTEEHPQ